VSRALNDLDVAARLVEAIRSSSMETVSRTTKTPPSILLDMCNLARGFNQSVLHFLRLRRLYLEVEPSSDAQCLQWYIVAGSPNAHRFAISGFAGRKTSICGMLTRDTEFLQPATDKTPHCRNCERG
jgi:hypothetical protein